jgi:hypothetical protein
MAHGAIFFRKNPVHKNMSQIVEILPEQAKRIEEWGKKRREVGLIEITKAMKLLNEKDYVIKSRTSMVDGEPMTIIQETKGDILSGESDSEKITLFVGPKLSKKIKKEGIVPFPKPQSKKK